MSLDIFNTFDRARDEAAFREFDRERLVHNIAQAEGVGEFNNAGVIDGAAGLVRDMRMAQQQADQCNKDNVETQMLLASLRELQEARSTAVQELNEIRENKTALDTLKTLHDNGELDPDNEEHQKLMKKAGITREDLMTDPTGAFDRQARFWEEREQNKIREIEGIDRDIARTQKIVDASPEERRELLRTADGDIARGNGLPSKCRAKWFVWE